MNKIGYIFICGAILATFCNCNKDKFLDKKPSSSLVIPSTLQDFQALLDNTTFLNQTPALPTLSGDEYFIPTLNEYNSLSTVTEKNSFIWATDIFGGEINRLDWNTPYQSIFYANEVIYGINQLEQSSQQSQEGKQIRAQAYFVRAWNYYALVQTFAKSYTSENYQSPGLPLKLTPNIDEIQARSSLKETYDQIFADINYSCQLFNNTFPVLNRNRGSKIAAYALLSRIYLNIHDYEKANSFADSTLNLYNKLIDYNTISTSSTSPFPMLNDEVILRTTQVFDYSKTYVGNSATAKIDTNIIRSYSDDDLRKKIFFRTTKIENETYYTVKRGYNGTTTGYPFSGLAVDEIYLIKAECLARSGELEVASKIINDLLITRYKSGTYTNIQYTDKTQLLSIIYSERKKELVWRSTRWADIKRLNEEGENITLSRNIEGKTYILKPNSSKYVMPIPQDEIDLSNKVTQNERFD
ncbi:Starch-binding associating with outer membrane [Chitinophaga costaii]|uniref:Starch-binding associating with outer membrane n=1 Tax=Chitinophaga costaii TaxID=1335309 RepID=A0A1C3YQV8_9BACT|nr:RagB/SusD family nutrient uptake outer membrane protein [Chitinophaga costaii]PUZ30061.1 RagB/SusD family nutrient uptake outer membrane protein [Chitinophaga costaii]SCB72453.1 Starch-binding associating with outer membrane [Chitinophaga costaii]